MTTFDIPTSFFDAELGTESEPGQKIKASKDVDKENLSLVPKAEYKKPADRKRKLPLQESEGSRPRKRAKVEKTEQIAFNKADPLQTELKEDTKDAPFKVELNLHLSADETKSELAVDPELFQSPEKLKLAIKGETTLNGVTPVKVEALPVKSEQSAGPAVHPFDLQQGIEVSKITEDSRLYLGNADVAGNSVWLLASRVTHIVNVASEIPNYYEKVFFHDDEFQFTYRKEAFNDSEHENIMHKLDELTDFIKEGLQSGSVLVHCKMGQSRSVSIIYAYLIRYGGMTLKLAKMYIEEELKIVTKLNNGFKKQLMEFEKKVRETTEASFDFFVLPKRISTPPAHFRTLDEFSQRSKSLNGSPATPTRKVNSASPRRTPTARKTNSARKAATNTKKLLAAAKGVPSVKDMLERQLHHVGTQTSNNNHIDSSHQDTSNNINKDANSTNQSASHSDTKDVNSEAKSDSESAHSSDNETRTVPAGRRISLKLNGVIYK